MEKIYYKIDVPGHNGYSFMVTSTEQMGEYEVIRRCDEMGFFDDKTDARYAIVDDLVTQYDIDNFEKSGCIREL